MAVIMRAPATPEVGFMSRPFASHGADALALAVGFATSFTVHLVGELPVAEAILVPVLPLLLVIHGRRVMRPSLRPVLLLMGLWLFGQVITDVYRGTATAKWMRGDAQILFFAVDLLGLAILLGGNERRKAIFVFGLATGSIAMARFTPSAYALDYPWKFGYSAGTITLVLLASCYFYGRRKYVAGVLLILGIAAVNLLANYRSPVLGLLVAIVLVFPVIPERIGRMRILPRAGSTMRVVVLAGLALGAGWLAGRLVDFVTSAGLISEDAQAKNQSQSKAGGILLGGRPEIQVSIHAVMDSPILGHGSWPQDYKYIEMLFDIVAEYGDADASGIALETADGLIPAHSHIMAAWVWAGILGAAFWAYIFWFAIKGTIRVSNLRPPLAPLYAYLAIGLIWNILFSPFGLSMRILDAIAILIMCDLLEPGTVVAPSRARSFSRGWQRQGPRERALVASEREAN